MSQLLIKRSRADGQQIRCSVIRAKDHSWPFQIPIVCGGKKSQSNQAMNSVEHCLR